MSPEEGFGDRDDELVLEIDRSDFPEPKNVKVGDEVVAESPDGDEVPMRVVEVKDETVVVDANHPLAGVTLRYAVMVKEIAEASEEEIAEAAAGFEEAGLRAAATTRPTTTPTMGTATTMLIPTSTAENPGSRAAHLQKAFLSGPCGASSPRLNGAHDAEDESVDVRRPRPRAQPQGRHRHRQGRREVHRRPARSRGSVGAVRDVAACARPARPAAAVERPHEADADLGEDEDDEDGRTRTSPRTRPSE